MPIVTVQMYPGRTKDQKVKLAKAITDAVAAIAGTTAEATQVLFQEVAREDWAQGGVLASERK